MKDFKNIYEAANFIKNEQFGLNDISVGIAYNTNYVEFEPENN